MRDWHARSASETRIRESRFSHVASHWFCSYRPLRLSSIVASCKIFLSSLFQSVKKRKSKTLRQFCVLVRNVQTLQVLTQFRLRDWNWNVKISTNFCLLFSTLVFCVNISALRLIGFTWKLAFFFSVLLFQNMEKLEIVIAVLVLCLVALVVYAVTSWTLTRKKRRNADADSEKDAVPYKYLEEEAEHVRKKVATAYAQETMPRITITPVQPRPDFPKVRDGLNLLVTSFICIGGLSSGKRIYQVSERSEEKEIWKKSILLTRLPAPWHTVVYKYLYGSRFYPLESHVIRRNTHHRWRRRRGITEWWSSGSGQTLLCSQIRSTPVTS